jgi:hypothetical protein
MPVIMNSKKSSRNEPERDDGAGDEEEGQVDMGMALPSHQQPSEVAQPGEGALHNPAVAIPF